MNADYTPAEPFPPGDYISRELAGRDLSLEQFASDVGISGEDAERLLDGRLAVTPEIAEVLASVLCFSPGTWLRLQASYERALARQTAASEGSRSADGR